MRIFVVVVLVLLSAGAFAAGVDDALLMAQRNCVGISGELSDLKKMAGIGAAVSGVGVATGGVALGAGIAKANVDERLEQLKQEIIELSKSAQNIPVYPIDVDWAGFDDAIAVLDVGGQAAAQKNSEEEKLEKKSKTLGNVRTGMLGASTVTNIVGAVVANESKVKGDLQEQINACLSSVKVLEREYNQARISRSVSEEHLEYVKRVITECSEWQMVDMSVVNSGARGAVVSSGVAAGAGAVGTVTSAMANSDSVQKNLNTVSNVMAGGATVASVAATVFNVKQMNSVKKIVAVADNCEGVLKK